MSEQELNKIISNRISYYMKQNNVTQLELAEYMGVSQATVSNWQKGVKTPRMSKIDKICKFFNIKRSDLMEDKSTDTVEIKVLGRVAAGVPIDAIENIISTEEIPASWATEGEYFGLEIKGDSMEPQIHEGDIIIVRKQSDANTGDIVVVTVNGDDATCKRLYKYQDGISLISFNPNYKPMNFSKNDEKNESLTIWGKVVESRTKF